MAHIIERIVDRAWHYTDQHYVERITVTLEEAEDDDGNPGWAAIVMVHPYDGTEPAEIAEGLGSSVSEALEGALDHLEE